MNDQILVRFIKYMAIATFVMFSFWLGWSYLAPDQSGDYYVRQGDIRLTDRDYDGAIESFNLALQEMPDHRGALMGRAIAFLQGNKPREAAAELNYLIDYLNRTLAPDDGTGRGVLAAAYANRGILNDRLGKHEAALADYIESLKIDEETVEGPGTVHKVLYGLPDASSVRKRAEYIAQQLKLPPEERLLRVPELDKEQRMYKP
ncbi:MAG: hypothetical protein OQJ87_05580 [Rhodospirillales bacterium]|nr:hypothetical protein [Rhodospirillales bacterium]MCW8951776.1 hypothetical protein [Rhodospirillales bacterium]MCW8970488.1 hypothetical protein [Rhodospirillales bacterium]MCW9002172.1 hypothetical protein [Rhodospirillales bacterium]MCW9040645.1 hypothetical protein [Rhodospirillales bacterium]